MPVHTIQPVYNETSRILIVGSFPSVKSREASFFYHHPQNRFWKILATIYDGEELQTINDKKAFLYYHHIAIWDVIQECTITGSSDSSIKDVVVNDFDKIIKESKIEKIYTNGNTAHRLYTKYIYPKTKIKDIVLPSSSPANAQYSLERLIDAWSIIKE